MRYQRPPLSITADVRAFEHARAAAAGVTEYLEVALEQSLQALCLLLTAAERRVPCCASGVRGVMSLRRTRVRRLRFRWACRLARAVLQVGFRIKFPRESRMRGLLNVAGRVMCVCCVLALAGAVGCKTEAELHVPPAAAAAGQAAAGQGGSVAGSDAKPGMQSSVEKGTPVSLALSMLQGEQADALMASSQKARSITAEQLRAQRERKHVAQLGYDPTTAQGFDAIQKSGLGLNDAEQKSFKERGFVVGRHTFATMIEGYAAIYMFDLPLYVSADSILDSVSRGDHGEVVAHDRCGLGADRARNKRRAAG